MDTLTVLKFFVEIVIIIILCRIILRIFSKPERKLPPGPIGLPFVGYLPFLTKTPFIKFSELRKKYGNVFSLYLGRHYAIVIGDPTVMREALSRPEFLGRPDRMALAPDKGRISLTLINGQPWIEQKRFVLQAMKELGMGKARMEEHIINELVHLIEDIQSSHGNAIEIKPLLASCTNNIILSLVCGRRLSHNDDRRKQLNRDLEMIASFMGQTSVQAYIAPVMKIPGVKNLLGYDTFKKAFGRTMNLFKEEIKRHKENLCGNEGADFVSDYLLEIQKRGNLSSSFSETMLQGNMMSLFVAGSETIRTTLDWALYLIAANPTLQRRIQKELDKVIGAERWPSYLDLKQMPYTESALTEVLRWRPALPINIQRCTLADTTLCGYDIPKGTIVLANIWDAHHNSTYWDNPDEFLLTRFLNNDATKKGNYMPFSYGRRDCPGKSLATMEIFLLITTVLQRFNVSLPMGCEMNFEGVFSLVNQPTKHKLCFTARTHSPENEVKAD